MQQLFFVALVLPEELQAAINVFKQDIHLRFGTKAALKVMPHLTLFPPFSFDAEKKRLLDAALKQAAQASSVFPVHLKHFNCFPPRTIFVALEENQQLRMLEKATVAVFSDPKGINAKKDSRPFHPHVTIANRDWTPDLFSKAWDEYRGKEFDAIFTAKTISLLQLENGKWKIVAEEKLSG